MNENGTADCRCAEGTDVRLFPECSSPSGMNDRGMPSNPFNARLPDCPSGPTLPIRERTRPQSVLLNIRTTFEGRSPNQYMEQLTENFIFIPDPADIILHPEVYQTGPDYIHGQDTLWNWEAERSFAVALLDFEQFRAIRFERWYHASRDEHILSEDGFSERFIFPYEVAFVNQSADSENTTAEINIRGRMVVDLVTTSVENPVWHLSRWEDQRDVASARLSWGELRAEFSR